MIGKFNWFVFSKIKMKILSLLLFGFFVISSCAQKTSQLSDQLKEISGLELYKDSIFFAINDGGNKNVVYILSKKMELLKTVEISEVKNHDWEALALDEKYLYIGDIGNNLNNRKNLQIHRIPIKRLLEKTKASPETMEITYAEQRDFPPAEKSMYFDAEAMISHNGKLWIFTKNRSKPFDGKSLVYSVEFSPGDNKTIKKSFELISGKGGWLLDSFTGAASFNDYVYLLTYTKIIRYKWKGNTLQKVDEKSFPGYAQTEGISLSSQGQIYVANEAHKWLGRQKIQQIQWKK